MNGAESLVRTAAAGGIEICFANPGTTEMPLVAALDAEPRMRAVLGLFEGVCTGAADGWARMTGRPALTLLHLGPGFANGIANLHNARRAHTPVVNVIGDHATWHVGADAPLTADIASLAAPVSGWLRSAAAPGEMAALTAEAIRAARTPPGQGATLIAPADCQWGEATGPVPVPPAPDPTPAAEADVEAAAAALADGSGVLLLGGAALGVAGLEAAGDVLAATGGRGFVEGFHARMERGAGIPDVPRLPYFPEQAGEALAGATHLVLAGAREPVAFFAYPGEKSRLVPEGCRVVPLAAPGTDVPGALAALRERLGAKRAPVPDRERPEAPTGRLTPETLALALARALPEGAIVVDEAATSGLPFAVHGARARPHTVLGLTGGAIGQGLPCALGAALARPDRRVVAFQADGSGMYTLQALWTLAREALDVTVLVCANRSYRILQVELARAGVAEPGPKARALTDLGAPVLDWVALARGMGVDGSRVETADALGAALERALAAPGPRLIEAVL